MELGLDIKIKQAQYITTEQKLSLNVLQMPIMDLREDMIREFEENPLLELSDENDAAPGTDHLEHPFIDMILSTGDISNRSRGITSNRETPDSFFSAFSPRTLKQFLREQLGELSLDSKYVIACRYIVESINPKGFLDVEISEIAEHINMPEDDVLRALDIVHALQPEGVASRSLKEYLLIQLKNKNTRDEKLLFIVENCLELLAENKVKHAAKLAGVSVGQAAKYRDVIKTLNPLPAQGYFTGERDCFITPDAFIVEIDGVLNIAVNDRPLPCLTINTLYKSILKNSNDPYEKEYVERNLSKAAAYIKAIDQRKNTLTRTLEAIAEIQSEYLLTSRDLRPMTLKDIADRVSLHESTVSRTIKGKYVMTPKSLMLVKDLFTSKLKSATKGESVSSFDAKKEIKRLIAGENSAKPLSDRQISSILNEMGYAVSRRTVAKYRETVNIGSSSKRKSF